MMENFVRAAYEKGVFAGARLPAENGGIVTKGVPGSRDGFDARAVEGFFNGMLTIAPGGMRRRL